MTKCACVKLTAPLRFDTHYHNVEFRLVSTLIRRLNENEVL